MEVGCQAARAGRDAVPVEVYNLDIDVSKLHRNQYLLSVAHSAILQQPRNVSEYAHWCYAYVKHPNVKWRDCVYLAIYNCIFI